MRDPAPRWHLLRATALVAATAGLSGCCTSARCLDSRSGPDKLRVKARPVQLGVVHNDSVSSPDRDRTDWKYVELSRPGKLTVQLHWDTGTSVLRLDVFDVLGVKLQSGRPWGAGGRRAVVAIEEPGRYYIRVQAHGKRDRSHYSLRLLFRPDDAGRPRVCHDCKVGERKCLGTSAYVVCAKIAEGCTAWKNQFPCPPDAPCSNGSCGKCDAPCSPDERRCAEGGGFQVCVPDPSGCPGWAPTQPCPGGRRCVRGRCVRKAGAVVKPAPPPDRPKKKGIKARIISIYHYRGRMTLHLEIGNAPEVKPGQLGVVLAGNTDKALPGGEIKVLKVAGRFAIATTSLEKLGKNRWVSIRVR